MSESNGSAPLNGQFHNPTPFELICEWLPYLSDVERGRLRAMLIETRMVRRQGVTPMKTQPTEGE